MDKVLSVTEEVFSKPSKVLSVLEDTFEASDFTFASPEDVLSVLELVLSVTDLTFSVSDNTLSGSKDTLSEANKGLSKPDFTLSVVDLTLSVTDKGLSKPDKGLSEAEKVTSDRPKGLFLPKNRVLDVPKPFLMALEPAGEVQWLFLDRPKPDRTKHEPRPAIRQPQYHYPFRPLCREDNAAHDLQTRTRRRKGAMIPPMKPILIKHMDGSEAFTIMRKSAGFNLLEFWSWVLSDIYTNTTRGAIAEFLVAKALGVDTRIPRYSWEQYDLEYRKRKIEIKSTGYHQSWEQDELTGIKFKVGKKRGYEGKRTVKRRAHIYVLCLLAEKDRARVNPLTLDQWRFWILPTLFFDRRKRSQDSIMLNSLLEEVGKAVSYEEVRPLVDEIIHIGPEAWLKQHKPVAR